jgi:ParB family chromosome partitioning protein
MSKADQLGAGRFGGNGQSVSARRAAIAAATGVPTDGVAPPTKLSPHHISLNPDNPRTSLGDLTDLEGSLRDHGQKTAITVMNRDAYVRANPAREAHLEEDTTHVVVDGSRRLAASRDAGLPLVKVMVDDDQGDDDDELLESALVANIHREDMDPLDEARALERLLHIHGSQRALAKRLHRSQGWVSQRLALLGLTPELANALEQKTENVDLLRAVGNKPKEQQIVALGQLKQARGAKEAAKRKTQTHPPAGQTEGSGPRGDYAVITSTAQDDPPGDEGKPTDLPPEARQVPELRTEPLPPGRPLPYDDGFTVGQHLTMKMDPEAFLNAVWVMVSQCWDKAGTERTFGLLSSMLDAAVQRDGDRLLPLLKEFAAQIPEETADA